MIESVIPEDLRKRLLDAWKTRWTGQISLNFKDGRILSTDEHAHLKTRGLWCDRCNRMAPEDPGAKGWEVRRQKVFCPECAKR